jgi:two-component system, NtrC family, sensor kinase
MNNLRGILCSKPVERAYYPGMNSDRLEMIGSAAAGIAHDMNNQLHLIVNHLALRDIAAAQRAVEHCSALTASLLDYCRGNPVEMRSADPAAFLRNFATRLRLPDGIVLRLNVPTQLPAIRADPLALNRVLANLIANACDAMNGRGTLGITASSRAIEVSDSGPGIPPDSCIRVFDPFFTTKGAQGMGLGLSIVRDLMRQQGGSVTVHSDPGRGAQFTLRFRAG